MKSILEEAGESLRLISACQTPTLSSPPRRRRSASLWDNTGFEITLMSISSAGYWTGPTSRTLQQETGDWFPFQSRLKVEPTLEVMTATVTGFHHYSYIWSGIRSEQMIWVQSSSVGVGREALTQPPGSVSPWREGLTPEFMDSRGQIASYVAIRDWEPWQSRWWTSGWQPARCTEYKNQSDSVISFSFQSAKQPEVY